MNRVSLLQSFAMDKDGRIVSVADVANGKKCECYCLCCREPLVAKQGDIRVWHFAHPSGVDCEGAAESTLHLAAKDLVARRHGLMLPGRTMGASYRLADGREASAEAEAQAAWIDFGDVLLEEPLGAIRTDALGIHGTGRMIIEIAVSHFVDDEKRQKIAAMGIPAVEVHLDTFSRISWDWDALEAVVIAGVESKQWLVCPWDDGLFAEAEAQAMRLALAQTPPAIVQPVSSASSRMPERTRYVIGGRFVDVVERSFAITVWSPYDPVVNQVVKDIVRPLGGRWEPRFKNWLVPLDARDCLRGALEALAGG